jgi:cation diffusion facilitator family transporter
METGWREHIAGSIRRRRSKDAGYASTVAARILRALSQRRSPTALRRFADGESKRTIGIAFLANLVIAAAKLIAGLLTRSTAMLAEAAHSAADSINEIFLFIGLRREREPPDETHPFGHGRERFLWAFMASISSFLIGGCLSIGLAVWQLRMRHPLVEGISAWIVLAIAFLADGSSWLQSFQHARRRAKEYDVTLWRYLFYSSDPVVRVILVEDSAALIGLVIAALGLLLSRMTGTDLPDSLASLSIGLLLAVTAFVLARPLADFLVGRSLPPRLFAKLSTIVRNEPAIAEVLSLRAVYSGPEEVIAVAKVRPSPSFSAERLSRAMDALEDRIRLELPIVADVFVDFTADRARADSRSS